MFIIKTNTWFNLIHYMAYISFFPLPNLYLDYCSNNGYFIFNLPSNFYHNHCFFRGQFISDAQTGFCVCLLTGFHRRLNPLIPKQEDTGIQTASTEILEHSVVFSQLSNSWHVSWSLADGALAERALAMEMHVCFCTMLYLLILLNVIGLIFKQMNH